MTATVSGNVQAAASIPALIEAAFDTTRRQPTPERLVEIDRLLRDEIRRLQATARAMADRRPVRSRGWYALVNAAESADDALGFQNREGFAGALNVSELARRVIELQAATAPTNGPGAHSAQ
ncbi:DUF6415 family natural product biosynthesis protein [Streptomyces sp. NPDC046942]|uniref:DUF6415 family natural product biosynthesis protein n=1 Tax=Streptomyces sp. NPDC046942 TaxID=3155137 RepID=UPI0033F4ABC0